MALHDFPSMRQLRAFKAVARLESVSGAAKEINLSQPGVTQALRAIEARLGAPLFERRRSGCDVSDLGAALLPRVRRFFKHLHLALIDVGNSPDSRQGLNSAVPAHAAASSQPHCDFREPLIRGCREVVGHLPTVAAPLRSRARTQSAQSTLP